MNKTIKLTLTLLVAAVMITMASCQKEKTGVYQPKKKIQQVYYSSSYEDKTPFQHYEWNGDKLSSITHYTDFDYKANSTWVENFTYEDNRVTRVDNYTNSEYITYDYDGDHLKAATLFYRNAIACTWAVSYEGDHISKLVGTFYDNYYKGENTPQLNPLSHLLPQNVSQNVMKRQQQMAEQRHQEETYSIALLLTWTDNDITKIVFTGDGEYVDFLLQYDDKNCPWYGFMGGLEDYLVNFVAGHTGFTKHNLTSMIVTENHYVDTLCFAYQYDSDKYPILQTMYEIGDDDKDVLYFEY